MFGFGQSNYDEEPRQQEVGNIVNIKIFGVGGGGCNAINRLVKANVEGVEFIASNTDMMALNSVNADVKIQLGVKLTHGLGAGSKPDIGEQAAIESAEDIKKALEGANLVFITAGMGGGTGTGAAPIVTSSAKELGILTIAVVTKPFDYEGKRKMELAEQGIEKLRKNADVLVVIPNQKAFGYVPKNTPMIKVVQVADDVLHNSIVGITDIVVRPTLINLDFADIETVIKNKGTAHIGIGRAKGENRIMEAIRQAAASPLLESNIDGATELIVSVIGDLNMSAEKVEEALSLIAGVVAPGANIIHGFGVDQNLKDEAIVTVIATGFDGTPVEKADPTAYIINEPSQSANVETGDLFRGVSAAPQQQAPIVEPYSTDRVGGEPDFIKRLRDRGNK